MPPPCCFGETVRPGHGLQLVGHLWLVPDSDGEVCPAKQTHGLVVWCADAFHVKGHVLPLEVHPHQLSRARRGPGCEQAASLRSANSEKIATKADSNLHLRID